MVEELLQMTDTWAIKVGAPQVGVATHEVGGASVWLIGTLPLDDIMLSLSLEIPKRHGLNLPLKESMKSLNQSWVSLMDSAELLLTIRLNWKIDAGTQNWLE